MNFKLQIITSTMGKKIFLWEYLLEGLIIGTAATNAIPVHLFLALFTVLLAVVYWRDGMQSSTIYYILIAAAMLIGQEFEIVNINAYAFGAVVLVQFAETPIYNLPQNKRLVGFRKRYMKQEDEIYLQFFPVVQNKTKKSTIYWNQGRGFQKIIDSKKTQGLFHIYHQITLSYIKRMSFTVGMSEQIVTKNGMAFCHGRDAAPIWYSSLMIHFASNNYKVGARQHPNLVPLNQNAPKELMKKCREGEVQITAEQYYQVIEQLNCEKIVLVAHSYGCSALLQAYHNYYNKLSPKVTHIILLDPYLFPLPDHLLTKKIDCPVLILANQYFLNFQDVYQRFRALTSKKNVSALVWKEGSDLYQTDLCFFFSNGLKLEEWEGKFKGNLQAIDTFMQNRPVEDIFGERDLGKQYKPEQYFPEKLFIF